MKKTHNILVMTYWDFNDALIQTYTIPYLNIIAHCLPPHSKIYLVCLNKKKNHTSWNHPHIQLIQLKYSSFGLTSFIYWIFYLLYLCLFIFIRKISTIHAWCMPAGMMGYLLSNISRKPLIIDSYEPHAESMVECGEWSRNGWAYKMLFFFERKMTHHAKYLIATTKSMIDEYAPSRYQYNPSKNNYFVKPACVDTKLFCPSNDISLKKKLHIENKIIGIYAGKFGGIYLQHEFFEIIYVAHQYWNHRFHLLLLSSISDDTLQYYLHKYQIPSSIITKIFVPHAEVPLYLNIADFGITPVKPVYTKRFCAPIKNGEYWAMGLPILITAHISDDSDIIEKNNIGAVIKQLNSHHYYQAIQIIDQLLKQDKNELKQKIRNIAIQYRSFAPVSSIYEKIYKE